MSGMLVWELVNVEGSVANLYFCMLTLVGSHRSYLLALHFQELKGVYLRVYVD